MSTANLSVAKFMDKNIDRIKYLLKHASYNVITRKETEELKDLIRSFSGQEEITDDIGQLQAYGLGIVSAYEKQAIEQV